MTIFFSWQSDIKPLIGRNFIERSLERAIGRLQRELSIEEAVREDMELDRDTLGVAGTPPIFDTILKKIDGAAIFLADVSFVGKRLDGSPTPNPNVLIEYGWALKSLTYSRIITVMNVAYGKPSKETMPFDMAHLRFPLQYDLPEDATDGARSVARESLTKALEGALRGILQGEEFAAFIDSRLPKPALFIATEPKDGQSKFRKRGEALGVQRDQFAMLTGSSERREIQLQAGGCCWLRVIPLFEPGRSWLNRELEPAGTPLVTLPLTSIAQRAAFLQAEDGCGWFLNSGGTTTDAVCFMFQSGELWAIGAPYALIGGYFALSEDEFVQSLIMGIKFVRRLGIQGPLRWIAGFEGIKGRQLIIKDGLDKPVGVCLSDRIELPGELENESDVLGALVPFFEKVYDSCGAKRP